LTSLIFPIYHIDISFLSNGSSARRKAMHQKGAGAQRGTRRWNQAISVAGAAVLALGSPRRYRGQLTLDDVSLDVECGSITGLLGRNGAGKTTLLRKHALHGVPGKPGGSDESNGEDATAVKEPAGRDRDDYCYLRPG
jgi:ABC-type polysaccharide/polyol phosphate transport system ATPase subunit